MSAAARGAAAKGNRAAGLAVRTVGFPRMHKEAGERRVFLPEFVGAVARSGVDVLLEDGYGEELSLPARNYRERDPGQIRFVDRQAVLQAQLVVVLRAPERDEFELLNQGTCLLSMLHFPTRSWRVAELVRRGVSAVAMDQITNDDGVRLVENLAAVAWNGAETAFDLLERTLPGLRRPDGEPLSVLVLGSGAIGRRAVDAAVKFGNLDRRMLLMAERHPGVTCTSLGRAVTSNEPAMHRLLSQCDILVDATQRTDASQPVVVNSWLAWLPSHAVIADLSVDPYLPDDDPPVVRAVEGIPRGNLDHFVFEPNDPAWSNSIPPGIPTENRRHVVSCYSWPGIYPEKCMRHYGRQLLPIVKTLVTVGHDSLSPEGDLVQRATYRGTLRAYLDGSTPRERMSRTASTGTGGDE